jgi:hypothetical protein
MSNWLRFRLIPELENTAFALVDLDLICLYDGYHATVRLNDDGGARARLCGLSLRWRGLLEYRSGMALGDAGNGTFAEHNAIVFNELVHGSGKGGVPAMFFLPSLHTLAVCLDSWEVFSTWPLAQA